MPLIPFIFSFISFCTLSFSAFASLSLEEDFLIKRYRVLAIGDVMTHLEQINFAYDANRDLLEGRYDFNSQFTAIIPYLEADMIIGNFEGTLAGSEREYTGYPMFNAPDEVAEALANLCYSHANLMKECVMSMANNHILDKGTAGAKRTEEILNLNGITTTGISFQTEPSKPLIYNTVVGKIAILAYTYGTNFPYSQERFPNTNLNVINEFFEERLTEDIAYAKENNVELTILAIHWGNEYIVKPSAEQERVAAIAKKLDIDIILGTHPHILQPIDFTEESNKRQLTVWSLGNFISSQRTLPRERSVVLAIDLLRVGKELTIEKVSLLPTWVEMSRYLDPPVRVLPALITHDNLSVSKNSDAKRRSAGESILKFFNIDKSADVNGFYPIPIIHLNTSAGNHEIYSFSD